MNWFQRLLRRGDMEERLDAELRHHFESLVADKVREGLPEAEARRAARLQFGGVESIKEDCRDARGTTLIDSTLRDIRFAVRSVRHAPVFTAAAIVTLALGIGANAAIFQLLDSVFLRNLPVPRPDELVRIQIRGGNGGFGISRSDDSLTYPLFRGIRDHQNGMRAVFAWGDDGVRIGMEPDTRDVPALFVSGNFFSGLQLRPAAGRLLSDADDQSGCASPGVVLSHDFWRSAYGAQESAIGTRLIVGRHPLVVTGVAPANFTGLTIGRSFDIALPLCAEAFLHDGDPHFIRSDVFWLAVMGRLQPAVARERVSEQLTAISPELFATTAPTGYSTESVQKYKERRLEVLPGGKGVSYLRNQYSTSLWLLFGLTGLVLLIACANVANLMLARATSRRRELAVRIALGASRSRIFRQMLTESMLIAIAGALSGFALSRGLAHLIVLSLGTERDPLQLDVSIDWRVLAFAAVTAIATCLIFGLVPALRAFQSDPGETIKTGARGVIGDRTRFSFQRALIVAQVSLSVTLVVSALLLVQSFRNLVTLDPGFQTKGIVLASFDLSRMNIPRNRIKPSVEALLDEIRTVPQVDAAALTTNILIGGGSWTLGIQKGDARGWSKFTWVSPGYFETVQTPLISGRGFTANDSENAPKVAIVNQTFVSRYFPGVDPLGKTFRSTSEPGYPETEYQIVGIAKDTRYFELRADPPPQTFAPIVQHPSYRPFAGMYIRTTAAPAALTAEIKRRISRSHPGVGMDFRVFETEIRNSLLRERFLAALSGFFGVLAAALAAIGLYGVIAYIVASRRNEIGVRIALGASRVQVIRLFIKESGALVVGGTLLGLICAAVVGNAARSLLFEITPFDALTYVQAAALLAGVALLATYLPARRASRLDPMDVLRYE